MTTAAQANKYQQKPTRTKTLEIHQKPFASSWPQVKASLEKL